MIAILIFLYLAVFAAAVIFFDRYDAHLLRLTRRVAATMGAWCGVDCIPLARKANALGRPIIVTAVAFMTIFWAGRGDPLSLVCIPFAIPWAASRWFVYEPKLISQTAAEHKSFTGVITFDLWSSQRSNRMAVVLFTWCWLPFPNRTAAEVAGRWSLFAAILCSLAVAYLISIEQPPYEHVKLRDRLRVAFARPVGGEA